MIFYFFPKCWQLFLKNIVPGKKNFFLEHQIFLCLTTWKLKTTSFAATKFIKFFFQVHLQDESFFVVAYAQPFAIVDLVKNQQVPLPRVLISKLFHKPISFPFLRSPKIKKKNCLMILNFDDFIFCLFSAQDFNHKWLQFPSKS